MYFYLIELIIFNPPYGGIFLLQKCYTKFIFFPHLSRDSFTILREQVVQISHGLGSFLQPRV